MHANKSIVGVDIGSNSIRLISLSGFGQPYIHAYSEVESPHSVFTPGGIKEKEKLIVSLKTALVNTVPNHIRPHFACTALPESVIFTKVITLPRMRKKELKLTINNEVTQILPKSIEEMEVDYQILGFTENQTDVLVVAAAKTLILDTLQIFQDAGLSLIRLESKPLSLARLLLAKRKDTTVLVDIGANGSSIAIYDYNQLKVTATVPVGGDEWRKALENKEDNKPPKVSDYTSTLSVILDEIENAINYHQNRSIAARPIEEIILAGGGSVLTGLTEYFEEKLRIPTTIAQSPIKMIGDLDNRYLVAIGAALNPPV